jgi:hypothetical protein
MSRLLRIRDALDVLVLRDEPLMRRMLGQFEREARLDVPGVAHQSVDGWLIFAREFFEAWWHSRVTDLLGEATKIVDDEDRLIRIRARAGPDLEALFARYQTERVYHRLPRQAMSSEAFELYVNEIVRDARFVGDSSGPLKRRRY